jgi:3-methylfumaryl-CoA hydratase
MQDSALTQIRQNDVMDPARAQALQATLNLPITIGQGDTLPPFFHQIYFWTPQPPGNLGRDGHPKTGLDLIPDMGLPRRMWAGGRLEFHAPLCAGSPAEKVTTLESTSRKDGRTGPLGFVTLRHEIIQDGATRVTEWQDLVYRQDPDPSAPKPMPPSAPTNETASETHSFNPTLLFRYSALTFNGHRIHYDTPYAQSTEGYDNLVTHGPLLAQLLMLFAERQLGALRSFSFRATSPLTLPKDACLCWNGSDMWVRGPDGVLHMTAKAD